MICTIATLGCKANQYESQRIREALNREGYHEAPFGTPSDLTVINTCTVTHQADVDNRRLIRKALGCGRVIVTGCQAVTDPGSLQALSPCLEVLAPSRLAEVLPGGLTRGIHAFAKHARAFVKVQDGCDHACSYCVVPRARGRSVSRPLPDIVDEINTLTQSGYREVILTGINIGLYEGGLAALIKKILTGTTIERIRLSSVEPWTFDAACLEIMESPRICKHLHLPLQSGSKPVLAAMGRPYTPDYYAGLVSSLKRRFPDMALGTDIMVGFPGEDEAAFEESRRFIASLPLSYLHVFAYSPRPLTVAETMPGQVSAALKRQRAGVLKRLSVAKRAAFLASQQGSVQEVLVTGSMPASSRGISGNYLSVEVHQTARRGEIIPVRIASVEATKAWGHIHG